jgi:hypothetical protein
MAKGYGTSGTYDEEEVTADQSYIAEDPTIEKENNMYDEEEYLAEVGEMNCYCVPTRVSGFKDFMLRTLGWTLLNKEQIFAAFTGERTSKRRLKIVWKDNRYLKRVYGSIFSHA